MADQEICFELTDLRRQADGLTSAGVGLERIGLMLSERGLSSAERNGLEQAVIALGDYVRSAGLALYARAEKADGGAK